VIPSAEELKKIKYCKWHNATSHSTNECKVFRQQLQSAKESERINLMALKLRSRSEVAEKNTSVDPQHQVPTGDVKRKGLLKESSSSRRPPQCGIVGNSGRISIDDSKKRGI